MLTATQAEELCRSFEGKLLAEKVARATTNRIILKNLRDGFAAGKPRLIIVGRDPVWSVPILASASGGAPGDVGEVLIQAVAGAILAFTPPAEVYRNARQQLGCHAFAAPL